MKRKRIKNPCKGKCYDVDYVKNFCNGCGRTTTECRDWPGMSDKAKLKIVRRIAATHKRAPEVSSE